MELQKNLKNFILLTILILISLYIIFTFNEESTTQEAPKRATLVRKLEEKANYG
ncbi:MAG: hypothetical protein GX185_07740 [Tissierellia bacterium]|nr:hypothetical protein [Tissierellia bacterium]